MNEADLKYKNYYIAIDFEKWKKKIGMGDLDCSGEQNRLLWLAFCAGRMSGR